MDITGRYTGHYVSTPEIEELVEILMLDGKNIVGMIVNNDKTALTYFKGIYEDNKVKAKFMTKEAGGINLNVFHTKKSKEIKLIGTLEINGEVEEYIIKGK